MMKTPSRNGIGQRRLRRLAPSPLFLRRALRTDGSASGLGAWILGLVLLVHLRRLRPVPCGLGGVLVLAFHLRRFARGECRSGDRQTKRNGNRENTHRCSPCDVFLVNWVTRSMFLHNAGNAGPDHHLDVGRRQPFVPDRVVRASQHRHMRGMTEDRIALRADSDRSKSFR